MLRPQGSRSRVCGSFPRPMRMDGQIQGLWRRGLRLRGLPGLCVQRQPGRNLFHVNTCHPDRHVLRRRLRVRLCQLLHQRGSVPPRSRRWGGGCRSRRGCDRCHLVAEDDQPRHRLGVHGMHPRPVRPKRLHWPVRRCVWFLRVRVHPAGVRLCRRRNALPLRRPRRWDGDGGQSESRTPGPCGRLRQRALPPRAPATARRLRASTHPHTPQNGLVARTARPCRLRTLARIGMPDTEARTPRRLWPLPHPTPHPPARHQARASESESHARACVCVVLCCHVRASCACVFRFRTSA